MPASIARNVFLPTEIVHRGWNVQVGHDRAVAFRGEDSIDFQGRHVTEPSVSFIPYSRDEEKNPQPFPGKSVDIEPLELIDPTRGHLQAHAHTYRVRDVSDRLYVHYGIQKSALLKAVKKVPGHGLYHAHDWNMQYEIAHKTPYAASPDIWKRRWGQARMRFREMGSGIAASFNRPREAGENGGRLIQMSTPLNGFLIMTSSLIALILVTAYLRKQQKLS